MERNTAKSIFANMVPWSWHYNVDDGGVLKSRQTINIYIYISIHSIQYFCNWYPVLLSGTRHCWLQAASVSERTLAPRIGPKKSHQHWHGDWWESDGIWQCLLCLIDFDAFLNMFCAHLQTYWCQLWKLTAKRTRWSRHASRKLNI